MTNNKSELKVPKILAKKMLKTLDISVEIFLNCVQDCRKDYLGINSRAECDNELEELLPRGENRFTHFPRVFNALNLQL